MSNKEHGATEAGPAFVQHNKSDRLPARAVTSHTDHRLCYVVDGSLRMVHGSTIEVKPGSVMVVPAGAPHQPLGGTSIESWVVGFCPSCYRLDEGQLLMSPFRKVRLGALPIVPIPKSRRSRVLRVSRDLQEECERGDPESSELIRSLLLIYLGEVHRAMRGDAIAKAAGSLVSDALEFIQKYCLSAISLKDVAANVHRTPAHVATTVKKFTGHSVGEWIRSGRIAEAAARLVHTEDSLDEIASHVGWQDKTHFIRQFRKTHGTTPAAWRRQHRAKHAEDQRR